VPKLTVQNFLVNPLGVELRILDANISLGTLHNALRQDYPKIHRSDQDVQYVCAGYTLVLESAHTQMSMANVGQA
jgi:hypothetical protein